MQHYRPVMTPLGARLSPLVATFRARVLAPLVRTFRHESRTGHEWIEAEQPVAPPVDAER